MYAILSQILRLTPDQVVKVVVFNGVENTTQVGKVLFASSSYFVMTTSQDYLDKGYFLSSNLRSISVIAERSSAG